MRNQQTAAPIASTLASAPAIIRAGATVAGSSRQPRETVAQPSLSGPTSLSIIRLNIPSRAWQASISEPSVSTPSSVPFPGPTTAKNGVAGYATR